jgi:hypothetical protein
MQLTVKYKFLQLRALSNRYQDYYIVFYGSFLALICVRKNYMSNDISSEVTARNNIICIV